MNIAVETEEVFEGFEIKSLTSASKKSCFISAVPSESVDEDFESFSKDAFRAVFPLEFNLSTGSEVFLPVDYIIPQHLCFSSPRLVSSTSKISCSSSLSFTADKVFSIF